MTANTGDPHKNVPDQSRIALLLIDVINDLDFPDADRLLRFALPMSQRIRSLKNRARQAKVPVIYVNDNFGRWRSDFKAQIEHCMKSTSRGRPIVEILQPDQEDYFVLKPKHSAFYCTTLDILLANLGARTLILTGIAANICVLFTANDAYMRDFSLLVPRDCVASNTIEENTYALNQMETILKANLQESTAIAF